MEPRKQQKPMQESIPERMQAALQIVAMLYQCEAVQHNCSATEMLAHVREDVRESVHDSDSALAFCHGLIASNTIAESFKTGDFHPLRGVLMAAYLCEAGRAGGLLTDEDVRRAVAALPAKDTGNEIKLPAGFMVRPTKPGSMH